MSPSDIISVYIQDESTKDDTKNGPMRSEV